MSGPTAKLDPWSGYNRETQVELVTKTPFGKAMDKFVRRSKMEEVDAQIHDEIGRCYADPLRFVLLAYDWGRPGPLLHYKGPQQWQRDFLKELGEEVAKRNFDGHTPVAPIKMTRSAGKGVGKAQPVDSIIETPSGRKRFGDINPGDTVFSDDGSPVVVIAVHERGILPVNRVSFDDKSSTLVCDDHLWKVRGNKARKRGDWDSWEILSTRELRDRGIKRNCNTGLARNWEVPIQGAAQFKFSGLPIDPYTLGAWLGDGSRNTRVITTTDIEVRQRVEGAGYKTYDRNGSHAKRIKNDHTFGIVGIGEHLLSLGVYHCRSHEKFVPGRYKYNSIDVRAEVLRGLMDTDGYVNEDGSASFTSTSKDLACDLLWIVRSLGGKGKLKGPSPSSYRNKRGEVVRCKDSYDVLLRMPDGFELFALKRKQQRLKGLSQKRYRSRWIDSIEPAGEAECRCITVANENGLYLTNDFIVTHNSAISAWIVNWIMSTRPNCQGTVTANTFPQLQSKTWAAIQAWTKRCITSRWFECSGTKLYHATHGEQWFTTAQTAKEENSESFAGQHAATSTQFYIFDESSAIPNKIFEVAESGMTDGEPMMFCFGNATRSSGRFFQINFGVDRKDWNNGAIDSRTCELANQVQNKEWVDKYGEDSDWVRVYVKGMPPNAGDLQFIDNERVYSAQTRPAQCLPDDPLIAGVDVSRGGADDTIVRYRKGLDARSIKPLKISGDQARDSMLIVSKLAEILTDRRAGRHVDAMFIDSAFGGPIVNRLRQLGHKNVFEINFGSRSPDVHQANMRAYIWQQMKDWLTMGAIDKDPELEVDLTGPGFHHDNKERLVLEAKEDMASRGLDSPDDGDALALTFAQSPSPARSRPAARVAYSGGATSWT